MKPNSKLLATWNNSTAFFTQVSTDNLNIDDRIPFLFKIDLQRRTEFFCIYISSVNNFLNHSIFETYTMNLKIVIMHGKNGKRFVVNHEDVKFYLDMFGMIYGVTGRPFVCDICCDTGLYCGFYKQTSALILTEGKC